MKKVHLVVQGKDMLSTLQTLRDAGVVHVEHVTPPQGARIKELKEDAAVLERAIQVLTHEHKEPIQVKSADCKAKAQEIMGLAGIIDQLKDHIAKQQGRIEQWEPWGDFNVEDIEFLRAQGFTVELVEIPQKELKNVPEGIMLETIFVRHKVAHCLAIARGKKELPFKIVRLPAVGLHHMKAAQAQNRKRVKEAQEQLLRDSKFLDCFRATLSRIEEELTFQKVYAGKGDAAALAYVRGFCPEDLCPFLERLARREHWALLLEDPSPDDQVPTLLRAPRWAEAIRPVFNFMNVLPGYREMDVSAVFLLFFSIFYGMLIGDAGYGLIFIALTLLARRKWGGKIADKNVFSLLYLLNGVAVLWGLLTGTFLGQHFPGISLPPLWPWLTRNENVQLVCFIIGAVHLSVAHLWRMILIFPSLTALAEFGCFLLVWFGFLLARFLILGQPLPWFHKIFVISGSALLIFFGKPQKNILKTFGAGLGDYLLRVVSFFADIVSYIRLYAVGYASVLLADTFNQMAAGVGFHNPWAGFFSALILVAGHALNIILGSLAILVHGLRLNILEFSQHIGLEWAGLRYQPFQRSHERCS